MRVVFSIFVALAASVSHAYDIYSGGVPLPPDHGVWIPVTLTYEGQQPLEVRAMPLPTQNFFDYSATILVQDSAFYISNSFDGFALWTHAAGQPYYWRSTFYEVNLAAVTSVLHLDIQNLGSPVSYNGGQFVSAPGFFLPEPASIALVILPLFLMFRRRHV